MAEEAYKAAAGFGVEVTVGPARTVCSRGPITMIIKESPDILIVKENDVVVSIFRHWEFFEVAREEFK